MTKKSKPQKKEKKPPSLAEQKKEILAKTYGTKQSKEIKNLLKKMEIQEKLKAKEKENQNKKNEYILNVPTVKKEKINLKNDNLNENKNENQNLVCRYLILSLQNKTFSSNWKCPINCKDVHKINENQNLEEFLEMQRCSVQNHKLLDKNEYDLFVKKLEKEKKCFLTGIELFKKGMFKDVQDEP